MASWTDHEPPCAVCSAKDHDRAGHIKHQAWCAHFMAGPDPGGDPYEWPSLLDAPRLSPLPSLLDNLNR